MFSSKLVGWIKIFQASDSRIFSNGHHNIRANVWKKCDYTHVQSRLGAKRTPSVSLGPCFRLKGKPTWVERGWWLGFTQTTSFLSPHIAACAAASSFLNHRLRGEQEAAAAAATNAAKVPRFLRLPPGPCSSGQCGLLVPRVIVASFLGSPLGTSKARSRRCETMAGGAMRVCWGRRRGE